MDFHFSCGNESPNSTHTWNPFDAHKSPIKEPRIQRLHSKLEMNTRISLTDNTELTYWILISNKRGHVAAGSSRVCDPGFRVGLTATWWELIFMTQDFHRNGHVWLVWPRLGPSRKTALKDKVDYRSTLYDLWKSRSNTVLSYRDSSYTSGSFFVMTQWIPY